MFAYCLLCKENVTITLNAGTSIRTMKDASNSTTADAVVTATTSTPIAIAKTDATAEPK